MKTQCLNIYVMHRNPSKFLKFLKYNHLKCQNKHRNSCFKNFRAMLAMFEDKHYYFINITGT